MAPEREYDNQGRGPEPWQGSPIAPESPSLLILSDSALAPARTVGPQAHHWKWDVISLASIKMAP